MRYGYTRDSYHLLVIRQTVRTISAVLYNISSQNPISYQFMSIKEKNCAQQEFYESWYAQVLWEGGYVSKVTLNQEDRADFLFVMRDLTNNEFKLAQFRPGCTLCSREHYSAKCPLYAEFVTVNSNKDSVSVESRDHEDPKWFKRDIYENDVVNKFNTYIKNFESAVASAQSEYFDYVKTGGPVSPRPLSFGVLYPSEIFSAHARY